LRSLSREVFDLKQFGKEDEYGTFLASHPKRLETDEPTFKQ
jgi:hypothetical protein